MKENLHEKHRQRTRERFLQNGLESFNDHQVLELMLFFSIPRCDTNETAHRLLNKYGSLSAVFDAGYSDFLKQNGVGTNTATLFSIIPELARRYMIDKSTGKRVFKTMDDITELLINHFIGQSEEYVELFMFDASMKLIAHTPIQKGDPNSTSLNPQIIAESVFEHNAVNFLLAHNHPSGSLEPSDFDLSVTREIYRAFLPMNKRLIDHIIVAGGECNLLLQKSLNIEKE
ncbi:MAG: hypothetical protein E7591_00675 [Ruminococcaceae bacterium]|nr:hypothetical protein [Oscillospiraceae bacterium]